MIFKIRLIKLRIEILDITPPIWRQIGVPDDINLQVLHQIIQEAFGWTNSHLHEFRTETQRFCGKTDGSFGDDAGDLSEEDFIVAQVLKEKGDRMLYTYDFGDNWEHLHHASGSMR